MDLSNLEQILESDPDYRKQQAKKAVFQHLIEDWKEATALPLALRERLSRECPLRIDAQMFFSSDKKTVKAVITLRDGLEIESVLMRHEGKRNTVCVSSQVGCPVGCLFCATGKMGFKRNLESLEIVEQVLLFARYLEKKQEKVTNVVFMGMGEPFLNYENVLGAIQTLNDPERFNLGARNFSISTVGITEGIEKLAEEDLQVNLAVSLHAPTDKLRSKLVPFNKKYSVTKIMNALESYIKKTNRRVMLEYLVIKDFNDSLSEAEKLVRLIRSLKNPLCFVNLISYNPTDSDFRSSPPEKIKEFKQFLEKSNITVTERYRFGRDLEAACGQLARQEK
ncbi:MAG: 23S rRNA (adenine(2503)-C(2))-methyltransferase RlmN [Candidatus Nealsonbacteria bacterium]|nr:23S rRNA (adenine(2503)-C(2))-methyltransferase RlmN [Candidatus Nealsonbacteria bacterium]